MVLATKFVAPMSEDSNHRGSSRRWIMREVEDSLRRLGTDHIDLYQAHRPDPDTDIDDTLGALSDLVHQGKVRVDRQLHLPGRADRRGAVGGRASRPGAVPVRAAAVLDLRPGHRDIGAAHLPALRHGRDPVEPAGRRVADRSVPARATPHARGRPGRGAPRSGSTTSGPRTSASSTWWRTCSTLADEAGLSLTHLAMAFVLEHPAVTSAIIGPRTMEQLTDVLDGADIRLDDDVLDRIDELVPPGTNVNVADTGWQPASHKRSQRRRPRRPAS